ncbi:MAG: DUF4905 domain-containing protein [Cyclobacteriaceae bacterium]|nr:DUF4905 domain-containing protein [Cyclobacteriaceae bacterium]
MIEKTAAVYQSPPGFVIWNLAPAEAPYVVLEERNDSTRNVSIVCITAAGELCWRNDKLPESWWINLSAVTKTHVWLRLFGNTLNPDAVRLISLSVTDGAVIEAAPGAAHTIQPLRPFVYVQGEPDFDTVQKFLFQQLGHAVFLGAEYLEAEGLIFVSYYIGRPAAFTNVLACFRQDGSFRWSEEIGTNLKGMGTGTFFIASGTLFFVKNKTELVTFRIV